MIELTQMELGIPADACRSRDGRNRRNHKRAHWWFGQMRRAVDEALDCAELRSARPSAVSDGMPSRQVDAKN